LSLRNSTISFFLRAGQLAVTVCTPIRWLTLAMVGLTLGIVLLRYALGGGSVFIQESVMYMHGILFMLAIPMGIANNSHVRVDIFYNSFDVRKRATIDLLGHCIFLLPVAGFIFFVSIGYVENSWRILEGSSEVGGIPAVFLLKTLIPLTAGLIFLQGLTGIAQQTVLLLNTDETE
jgi:TRAP-type mannitol/chloroaromatic compound transport system permease small subunit